MEKMKVCEICRNQSPIYEDTMCRICKDLWLLNNYASGIVYMTREEIKKESIRIQNVKV